MKENEPIELIWSSVGRKGWYLAYREGGSIYPAVFFRKSKWITQKQLEGIVDQLREITTGEK